MEAYNVEIKGPKYALIGSTVNFTASLYDDGKLAPTNAQYQFTWTDNADPPHKQVSKKLNISIIADTL